jgi:osmotically-inducible protein OsmY
LLHAVASAPRDRGGENRLENDALRERVFVELRGKPWTHVGSINVIAHSGTIDLWGIVNSEKEKQAIRVAVENTPGVKAINDNLAVLPAIYGGL